MTIKEMVKTIEIAAAEVEWGYPLDYAIAFEEAAKALEELEEYRRVASVDELKSLKAVSHYINAEESLIGMRISLEFGRAADLENPVSLSEARLSLSNGDVVDFGFRSVRGEKIGMFSVAYDLSELNIFDYPNSAYLTRELLEGCALEHVKISGMPNSQNIPGVSPPVSVHDIVFIFEGGDMLVDVCVGNPKAILLEKEPKRSQKLIVEQAEGEHLHDERGFEMDF